VESAQLDNFASVPEPPWYGSKNANLFNIHRHWDAGTDGNGKTGPDHGFDHATEAGRCAYCGQEGVLVQAALPGRPGIFGLHEECHPRWYARESGRDAGTVALR
jgi:hypothetical protein